MSHVTYMDGWWDTYHSYVWHEWRITHVIRRKSHSYMTHVTHMMWHIPFICVTWMTHHSCVSPRLCALERWGAGVETPLCVTGMWHEWRVIHVCRSYVWQEFICVTGMICSRVHCRVHYSIHMCDRNDTHSYVWQEWRIIHVCHMNDVTHINDARRTIM